MDFGLVQSQDAKRDRQPRPTSAAAFSHRLDNQITVYGEVMGTPSYMSPEQHRGEKASPASDQFGFCVTLYDALYGIRPFVGESHNQLRDAIERRAIQPPKRMVGPRRLLDAVRKGLHAQPNRRHRSMDPLVAILQRFRRRRSRAWTLAATLGVAAAAGGYAAAVVTTEATPPPQCDDGPHQWAQVWNDETATAVRTAFVASHKPYAEDAWDRVSAFLNDYGQRWADQHQAACTATQIRGEQSKPLMDVRMVCLERRRSQVDALVRHLQAPKNGTVRHALSAVHALPHPHDCANIHALLAEVPAPADEATRHAVAQVRAILDDVKALNNTGQYPAAFRRVGRSRVSPSTGRRIYCRPRSDAVARHHLQQSWHCTAKAGAFGRRARRLPPVAREP